MHIRNGIHLLGLLAPTLARAITSSPLSTSGRWIVDSDGNNVTYVGANWPGAEVAMIPEGLQYQSIEYIVGKLKDLGMNVIRLTFAIEMIDDIYETGADVPIKTSLINALGDTNGTKIYEDIVGNNPQFGENTTRLEVYDAVATECYNQGIYVHLDNHVSKASWCCSTTDGNAWFGDTYFNVSNWHRGWKYMAEHVKSLPAVKSIGMRNELRSPDDDTTLADDSYNWDNWYTNMVENAKQVHEVNSDLLLFFSGLNYDTTLSPIPTASNLGNDTYFKKSDFTFSDKIVLELHNYDSSATSCSSLSSSLLTDGFNALETDDSSIVNVLPVVMTEFGYEQDNTTYTEVYPSCLRKWLPSVHAGWMIWVLSGSYYIRQGIQDYDETWGLLDHTWSDWRSSEAIENGIIPMVEASLG
ncbi:cellulase family protein [Aspergillus sclerotioniger CBS 115572]|uniref:Cellulase family protein n=1 Tax=Aspergillus sclerotioniger CBS 115572 TaxID=1450535 RepID=A0A317VTA2_9EURO|nr:cellulase family protein [Aspergillus sclerotioniger CBS 115572]PWY76068.1 cellulase family protein [Aspergillus sclerotioniger CBS 115572]